MEMKNGVVSMVHWEQQTSLRVLRPHGMASPTLRSFWLPQWLMGLNFLHTCNQVVGNSDLAGCVIKDGDGDDYYYL